MAVMPYSPLDDLIDAIPELKKAGKVGPNDTVSIVHARYAEILWPIVIRIQEDARKTTLEQIKWDSPV